MLNYSRNNVAITHDKIMYNNHHVSPNSAATRGREEGHITIVLSVHVNKQPQPISHSQTSTSEMRRRYVTAVNTWLILLDRQLPWPLNTAATSLTTALQLSLQALSSLLPHRRRILVQLSPAPAPSHVWLSPSLPPSTSVCVPLVMDGGCVLGLQACWGQETVC